MDAPAYFAILAQATSIARDLQAPSPNEWPRLTSVGVVVVSSECLIFVFAGCLSGVLVVCEQEPLVGRTIRQNEETQTGLRDGHRSARRVPTVVRPIHS